MPFIKEEGGSTFLAAPAARIVDGEAAAAKAVLGSDQWLFDGAQGAEGIVALVFDMPLEHCPSAVQTSPSSV